MNITQNQFYREYCLNNQRSYYNKGVLSLVLPQVGKLTIMMRNHLEGYNTNTNDS